MNTQPQRKSKNITQMLVIVFSLAIVTLAGVMTFGGQATMKKQVSAVEKVSSDPVQRTSLYATGQGGEFIEVILEPVDGVNTTTLEPGQPFQVNISLRAGAGDVYSNTAFQFDLSRLTGATVTSIAWNTDYFHYDDDTNDCGWDGEGGMPDCSYNVLSPGPLYGVSYLHEQFDPALAGDLDRAPVHLTVDPKIIATVSLIFNTNGESGQFDVCGDPHVVAQTGIAVVSMQTEYFDPASNSSLYSEYEGNVTNCGNAQLTLSAAAGVAPLAMDSHSEINARYANPPTGAINAQDPMKSAAGFTWVDIRFTGEVTPTSLPAADFTFHEFIAPDPALGGRFPVEPDAALVPALDHIEYNPIDTKVPGFNSRNVARLHFTQRVQPATWLYIQHEPSLTRTWLGYLPCDVNQDGICGQQDHCVLNYHFVRYHYYVQFGRSLLEWWQTDIDANGDDEYPTDIYALKYLRRSTGTEAPLWEGIRLPAIENPF